MLPEAWRNVRRLLVVRLDNIGDLVMLSPSLRALRRALPQAQITLLASPAGSQVSPLLPWIDDVLVQRAMWQELSSQTPPDIARESAFLNTLRGRNFDAVIIFTSFSQSPHPPAYACYLAGIPIRCGQSKEFGGAVLTQWVKPLPDEVHQVDRNLFLLTSLGIPVGDRRLSLTPPPREQNTAERLLAESGVGAETPFILLAPGASCAARRYPPERYAQVARLLAAESGMPLVVVGSARERELMKPIIEQNQTGVVSLVGRTSVPELAAVIAHARLVIANDSGPMHIADAFNRPMVILFSGTEYESQWRPRHAPTTLLRRPTFCSPCYRFQCPYDLECLDIPPQEVVAESLPVLQTADATAASTAPISARV